MATHRTRKSKENPHYQFLVSWSPTHKVSDPAGSLSEARVKGELKITEASKISEAKGSKRANVPAKDGNAREIKKDIGRSLMYVAIVLTLELVVYLAWIRFS